MATGKMNRQERKELKRQLQSTAVLHSYQAAVAIRVSGDFMRDDQVAALVFNHDLGFRADHRGMRPCQGETPPVIPSPGTLGILSMMRRCRCPRLALPGARCGVRRRARRVDLWTPKDGKPTVEPPVFGPLSESFPVVTRAMPRRVTGFATL